MASEIRHVDFQLPQHFGDYQFWPLGLGNDHRFPLDRDYGRMLVVSPFLTDGFLNRLTKKKSVNYLVSRLEELDNLDLRVCHEFTQEPVGHLSVGIRGEVCRCRGQYTCYLEHLRIDLVGSVVTGMVEPIWPLNKHRRGYSDGRVGECGMVTPTCKRRPCTPGQRIQSGSPWSRRSMEERPADSIEQESRETRRWVRWAFDEESTSAQ